MPLHTINCAHLGTGPLFKFNGIVYLSRAILLVQVLWTIALLTNVIGSSFQWVLVFLPSKFSGFSCLSGEPKEACLHKLILISDCWRSISLRLAIINTPMWWGGGNVRRTAWLIYLWNQSYYSSFGRCLILTMETESFFSAIFVEQTIMKHSVRTYQNHLLMIVQKITPSKGRCHSE